MQFHPESILTRHGFRLLANFLERAGVPHLGRLAAALDADLLRQAGDHDPAHDPARHESPQTEGHGPEGRVVTF